MSKKINAKSPPKKQFCTKCVKEQNFNNFYNTSNIDFYPRGKILICKECCYLILTEKGFEGFQALMRMINKPIYQDLFKGDYKDYVRMINSMRQYKDAVYEDSDMFRENRSLETMKRVKPKELSEDEIRESEEFWGFGYEEHEHIWLNFEYQDFRDRYEVDSKALENLIREICLTQLDIRNRRASGKDVDKLLKTLQDLLGSSNLKPMQETGAAAVDQETFGTLIKKWENERPIPEPDPAWADVDGIGKYVRTWFIGHLSKMAGYENPYAKEYEDETAKYEVDFDEDGDE